MAVITDGSPCLIIDRTFSELIKKKNDFSEEIVTDFCENLKKIGVDLLEVPGVFLAKFATLFPFKIHFVARVDSVKDFELYAAQENIMFILISKLSLLQQIDNYHHKIIFECQGNEIEEIEMLIKQIKATAVNVNFLRIQGLSRYMAEDWRVLCTKISREQHVKIDICPQNEYDLATSVALDLLSCSPGISSLSAAFTGIGSLAPLEEVITAAKVLKGCDISEDLSILPALKKSFEHLTEELVAPDKPIIGENIFKYESGIHADGIEKNPLTYEPFEPAMVGLERKLVIGKHSGAKALIAKLRELNISLAEKDAVEILKKVKKMSIALKREIYDHELVNICKVEAEIEIKTKD